MILDIAHCKSLIAILGINEAIQCLVFRHHLLVNFWRSSVFFPMINHFSNPLSALGAIAPQVLWAGPLLDGRYKKNLTLALQFSGSSANFKNCRLMTCNLCDVKKCLKVQHKSPNWKQKTLMIWGRFFLNDVEREGITDPLSLSLRTMARKKARKWEIS